MGFFNKNNEDFSEQWRKKYLNLLDAQNKIEHEHQEKEKLLRQFIIQLSIVSEGHDKNLDPILLRVRNHVKGDIESKTLKAELKTFTESIKNLPLQKKILNLGLLFEFLLRQYTSPQEQSALRELQAFAIKEETGFEQASDLFLEILKIMMLKN